MCVDYTIWNDLGTHLSSNGRVVIIFQTSADKIICATDFHVQKSIIDLRGHFFNPSFRSDFRIDYPLSTYLIANVIQYQASGLVTLYGNGTGIVTGNKWKV